MFFYGFHRPDAAWCIILICGDAFSDRPLFGESKEKGKLMLKVMINTKSVLRRFAKDEDGATAIEYGLFAALIAAVIVGTVATLGGQVDTGFTTVSDELTAADIVAPD